jgi:AbrB family looped-hinge helix DNA binding protein
MALVRIRRAAQITLPREIRTAARVAEGDYLEVEVTQGAILLRPVSVGRREPTPAQAAEIQAVADEVRADLARARRASRGR